MHLIKITFSNVYLLEIDIRRQENEIYSSFPTNRQYFEKCFMCSITDDDELDRGSVRCHLASSVSSFATPTTFAWRWYYAARRQWAGTRSCSGWLSSMHIDGIRISWLVSTKIISFLTHRCVSPGSFFVVVVLVLLFAKGFRLHFEFRESLNDQHKPTRVSLSL